MTSTDPQSLDHLRRAIDAVDDEVLALLNRRAGLAAAVGQLKAAAAPEATYRLVERLHWALLALGLVTVAGAVAGAHGFDFSAW